MRPLILVPTINSRHWNACYLQLLSVQRCQHPPQADRVHPSPPERCPQGSGAVLLKIEQSQLRLCALHS